jgi:hypothetical protein
LAGLGLAGLGLAGLGLAGLGLAAAALRAGRPKVPLPSTGSVAGANRPISSGLASELAAVPGSWCPLRAMVGCKPPVASVVRGTGAPP